MMSDLCLHCLHSTKACILLILHISYIRICNFGPDLVIEPNSVSLRTPKIINIFKKILNGLCDTKNDMNDW